jgi:hypothetical protein
MSPTARSLGLLRRDGWQVAVVEKWVPRLEVRSDLWHFGDVLAVHPKEHRFLIVQATTLENISSRLTKARSRPELANWLIAGGAFEVHGWKLVEGKWRVKIVVVELQYLGELAAVVVSQPPRKKRRSRWQPGELFAGLGEF